MKPGANQEGPRLRLPALRHSSLASSMEVCSGPRPEKQISNFSAHFSTCGVISQGKLEGCVLNIPGMPHVAKDKFQKAQASSQSQRRLLVLGQRVCLFFVFQCPFGNSRVRCLPLLHFLRQSDILAWLRYTFLLPLGKTTTLKLTFHLFLLVVQLLFDVKLPPHTLTSMSRVLVFYMECPFPKLGQCL